MQVDEVSFRVIVLLVRKLDTKVLNHRRQRGEMRNSMTEKTSYEVNLIATEFPQAPPPLTKEEGQFMDRECGGSSGTHQSHPIDNYDSCSRLLHVPINMKSHCSVFFHVAFAHSQFNHIIKVSFEDFSILPNPTS